MVTVVPNACPLKLSHNKKKKKKTGKTKKGNNEDRKEKHLFNVLGRCLGPPVPFYLVSRFLVQIFEYKWGI